MVALIWIALGLTLSVLAIFGWFWWRTRNYPDTFGGPLTSRIETRHDDRRHG